jgi:ribosomal-protein-alanine N-acetyltransferase
MLPLNSTHYLSSVHYSDAEVITTLLQSETIHQNLLQLPNPYTLAHALDWIDDNKDFEEEHPYPMNYAIRNKAGQFCGTIGFHFLDQAQPDHCAIGYWLGEKYWGQGIMFLAIKAIQQIAKNERGLTSLEADVFEWNETSKKVLLKAGFAPGIVVQKTKLDGTKVTAQRFVKAL